MYCHILRVRAIPTLESTDSMIYCIEQYIAVYCAVLCQLELDHWNMSIDKFLFLYENLRQLTSL